jgi:hypothetical protein
MMISLRSSALASFAVWAIGLCVCAWVRVTQRMRELRANQRSAGQLITCATKNLRPHKLPQTRDARRISCSISCWRKWVMLSA